MRPASPPGSTIQARPFSDRIDVFTSKLPVVMVSLSMFFLRCRFSFRNRGDGFSGGCERQSQIVAAGRAVDVHHFTGEIQSRDDFRFHRRRVDFFRVDSAERDDRLFDRARFEQLKGGGGR